MKNSATFNAGEGSFQFPDSEVRPKMEIGVFLKQNPEGELTQKPNGRASFRTIWLLQDRDYIVLLHFMGGLLGGISLSASLSTEEKARPDAQVVRKELHDRLFRGWFSTLKPYKSSWGEARSGGDFKTGDVEILILYNK